MPDYNLSEAFAVIEDYLIDSMRRNMLRHIAQEQREYFSWSQWQADMLSGLREYKRENADKFKGIYPVIEQKIEDAMQEAYDTGEATQEQVILSAIRKGYTAYRPKNTQNGEFFRMNKRKMNALVTETQKSMTKATAAALRMANDQYRSIIFGAQVFYNAGAGTLWQAVDMASKKFLQAGLNCIEYRDGRRVNIASYAEMALRTANTRAYLHGEAAMRERYGIHTVIVNRHNAACPLCVPFQGRVFIDDVWGGGTAAEAQVKGYPLLSEAMAAGLYHPNCKDGHTTFFVGINEFHPPTARMKEEQARRYDLQQQQRYHERQIRKYKRLCQGTIDEETRIGYTKKLHEWQGRTQELIDANPGILRRSPPREQLRNIPEELGITPPRNPPGVEIFASVKPPSEPPKKDKIRSVIDVKAYSTPKKPPPSIGPSEAERKRDIERIKAKVRMVKEKTDDMETDAKIARERALFATENAKAADYNAKRIRRASAEEIHSIKAKAKIRDKQVTRQMWDAKLSAAEARRLRRIAEIDKTEARAAQRRYVTLMKLDNDGKLKVSVETRTAHPTAVTVKPTPKSRPVATVSVQSKPPVTVSIADEQRKRDIETIRAKVRLVKQKAAEMEKDAQAARQAAQAAETKAQRAAQKAESAKQAVHSIQSKTKLRDQQVSHQMRDAKKSIAQAKKLRQSAEVAKTQARAAQRRFSTVVSSDEYKKALQKAGGSGKMYLDSGLDNFPVTEQSIQAIPQINYFDDEQMNIRFRTNCQDLLRTVKDSGAEPGTEFSAVYNMALEQIGNTRKGSMGRCSIDQPGVLYYAFHNHGSDLRLSHSDIIKFVDDSQQIGIVAIGNRGSIYGLFATIDSNKTEFADYLAEKAGEIIYSADGIDYSLNYLEQQAKAHKKSTLSGKKQKELESSIEKATTDILKASEHYGFRYIEIPTRLDH